MFAASVNRLRRRRPIDDGRFLGRTRATRMLRMARVPSLLLLVAACGPAPDPLPNPAPASTENPTGLLPLPAKGFQYVVPPHDTQPGSERTRCFHINLGNEAPIDVVRIETGSMVGLHHFNIFVSTLEREDGFGPCPGSLDLFAGARPIVDGSGSAVSYTFPEGVAYRVEPKTLLIFQLHELNVSTEVLPQSFVLNLHTDDQKEHVLADIYGFTNLDLVVPPKQRTAQQKDCNIDNQMLVLSMSTHFHARGVEATGALIRRGSTEETPLYRTDRWDNPQVQQFSPPVVFDVGDVVRFTCTYQNNDDFTVRYGGSAEDEMCFLFGYYYPKLGLIPCI